MKRLSINDVIQYLKESKPNIMVLSNEYKNAKTKLEFYCKKCKHIWLSNFNNLKNNKHGCPKCAGNLKLNIQDIKKRIPDNIVVKFNEITNVNEIKEFQCLVCDHKWKTTVSSLINSKTKCPECSKKNKTQKNRLTINDIKKNIKSLHHGASVISNEYENNLTKLDLVCEKGHKFQTDWANIQRGNWCRKCSNKTSSVEMDVVKFIENNNLEFEQNVRNIIKPYEIDIYLPKHRLGIEIHGLVWHSEKFNKDKSKHQKKHTLSKENNIKLLQFWDSEWNNKKDLVKSMILAKLNIFQDKIYARKCVIKIVGVDEAQKFLEKNHLMGKFKSAKHLGLYYNNNLVSMISYKKHKKGVDISRFCSIKYKQVIGGLSRLIKRVEKDNPNIEYIQYFVDLRYGSSDIVGLGFKHIKTTLGFWWTDRYNVYNRLYCKANMDERKLTQKEHAEELKLYKLYDAGQAKFIKELE